MNKYKGMRVGRAYQAKRDYIIHGYAPTIFIAGNNYELVEIAPNSHGDVLLEFKTEEACNLKIPPSRAKIIFGDYCL